MYMPNWMALDIYVLLTFITILFFSLRKDGSINAASKTFNNLIILISLIIVFDMMGRIEITNETTLLANKIGNYFIFILDPVMQLFTFYYIKMWLVQETRLSKIWTKAMEIFSVLNFVTVTISAIGNFGWFYYYENTEYIRGPFFIARAGYLLISVLGIIAFSVINRHNFPKQYSKVLILFPTIAMGFGIIQAFVYGLGLEYAGIVFACLMIFIYIQNEDANIDKLTNLYNRRLFDIKLEEQIQKATQSKTFALIMVDVDFFKQINDNFGHQVGDDALANVANILNNCFRKHSDIVARIGGDEFCIITANTTQDQLDVFISRIQDKVKHFNEKANKPYKLSLSLGYSIYDYDTHKKPKDFLNYVDEKMYQNKQRHHALRTD